MPDASPAVFAVNGEKPHQGVTSKNPGLHQRFVACNSTTALGVRWRQWSGTVPGATVSYEYDAFGNSVNLTGSTTNNYLFRGEQWDPDLGLYYVRARYYNPQTGRFMSRDPEDANPFDPKTLHRYLYAGGDPVNATDPTGRLVLAGVSLQDATNALKDAAAVYTIGVTVACELNITASVLQLVADPSVDKRTITPDVLHCSATAMKRNNNCTEQELESCQKLFEYCKGRGCGSCLSYCTVQCEWPFHKPECQKFNFPKDWKDYPPRSPWIN